MYFFLFFIIPWVVHATTCAWEPPIPFPNPGICALDRDYSYTNQFSLGHRTDNEKTDKPKWNGPYHCIRGPFCIYSNPNYNGGTGLVVITKSYYHDGVMKLHDPGKTGSWDQDAYRVEEIPGKGLGLVANRRLETGEVMMPLSPFFLIQVDLLHRGAEPGKHQDLLDKGFAMLPEKTKKLFLAQFGHFGGHRIYDILRTNAYVLHVVGRYGGATHLGLYPPEISRINHDCRPNIVYRIDTDLVYRAHVVRPILPGEEVTVSYVSPTLSRATRQKQLHIHWGFECQCQVCAAPKALATLSDQRLAEIKSIERDLASWWDFDTNIDVLHKLIRLYEEEKLYIQMHTALVTAAENAAALGYDKEAQEFAQRALDVGLLEVGMVHSRKDMEQIVRDPKRHRAYGNRIRIRKTAAFVGSRSIPLPTTR
ncbi:hypothetical protein B0T10DRAFT_458716 [Thelonectria olida]|uniref:SET domain-containing protein n=1 Tax=Thelonectria olida TaxID=1576542 RepID=A0A9P9AQI7_9HYPO|nr:hypothetical protein B0T10DRAFT_458716 [Thelonectria olida]